MTICFVRITPQISHVTHAVRVLHCGRGTRRITICFQAGIDILRFNISPRPASWLYGFNFSGIRRPGHDLHLVPRLKNSPLYLNKMARTSSGRHCRKTYHDMVHLFTSGFESTLIRYLRTFHFLLHMTFVTILVLMCLRACARMKQQLSKSTSVWNKKCMLTVKLLHGNAQYNLCLLRLYQSYVVYSWTGLEIYTQVT